MKTATAIAHPNIAFIKYWGDKDPVQRIPANGSISMNLENLFSRTKVTFEENLEKDELILDGRDPGEKAVERVTRFLGHVRQIAGITDFARVSSENNFPTGSGIASSASAFGALSLAASTAAGLELDEAALSRLARRGSGSACRSVPGGFVEWQAGQDDESSYAFSIGPRERRPASQVPGGLQKVRREMSRLESELEYRRPRAEGVSRKDQARRPDAGAI